MISLYNKIKQNKTKQNVEDKNVFALVSVWGRLDLKTVSDRHEPAWKRLRPLWIILLLVGMTLGIRLSLPWIIFIPARDLFYTPHDRGLPFEDVTFSSLDGVKLNGWYIPASSARGTLLFFHGNAGNISHRLDSISIFQDLGFSVFIFDYRGYGKSEGCPSISGVTRDALAAWTYLTVTREIPPDNIVVFGRSLGGAVAMQLMRYVRPQALILESTFPSLSEMLRIPILVPVACLITGNALDSTFAAEALTVPVLCLHSPDDDVVPYSLGRRLYERIASEKVFVDLRGDHNSGFLESDAYRNALDEFLTRRFGPMAPPETTKFLPLRKRISRKN
jgi:fermentation-respiration switch protein FrsA (DUF1100 family)